MEDYVYEKSVRKRTLGEPWRVWILKRCANAKNSGIAEGDSIVDGEMTLDVVIE